MKYLFDYANDLMDKSILLNYTRLNEDRWKNKNLNT